ncbi:hypothetical protein AM588_10005712 [Phytophthora nicotianae]|uniref:dihydrolipoyllysine-residue succinyltransferase n=1 Tax=Phytophthora nicotianae TaxID=4792 RepID=A0A0W8DAD8_PHYNI|nr:hypothetical protein AM588_10005712 [Phytophthora nicotianae]
MHNTPQSPPPSASPMANGSSFLQKAGHLYKKTGLGRSWRPRFFSLEGTVLYYYKRDGDSVPKGIVVLTGCHIRATKDKKLYSFRISHPKTSKVYDLAATLPSRTEDWIQALTQASTMVQTASSSRQLTSNASSSNVLLPLSSSSQSTLVDASITELLDVPEVAIPDEHRDRMEELLAEFVAQAQYDADGWKFQTEQRGVKAYVRRTSKTGTFKGVGFIAHHPHKVLHLILELSKRPKYDPQLLATQRVHVFNDHMWVDHLTYKAVFPAAARDFVNLTHWRVLRDGSIVVVATYAEDDSFVKNQEPQIVRARAIMAGFLLKPNEDYTGVNATYITKVDLKAGIPAGLQAKMFIKQAFVVDGLRKALDEDESSRQYECVTNTTSFGISTTDCVEDEEEVYSMQSQPADVHDQDDHGESSFSRRPSVVPEEGFPAVPEEYSEIIEKAVARMEAEMNDEASWNFIGDKDGVKAYTKVDGSLTAAKGLPRPKKRSASLGSAKLGSSVVKNGVSQSNGTPTTVATASQVSSKSSTQSNAPEDHSSSMTKQQESKANAVESGVMDLSKSGKNTVSDVAMYGIQFGGAVLALKTVPLPTAVHFVAVISLILFFALKLHLGPSRMSPRRKMMISTFGPPDSGMILGSLQLDMTKTNQYIADRRKDSNCHLTITHIVLRAIGEALSKAPSVNGHLVFGNYYPAPTVDISCLVAVGAGKDLGVCRLPKVDKMTLQEVVDHVRGDATKIRSGEDKGQEDRNKIMSVLPTWVLRPMVNFFGWLGSACGFRIPVVGVEPYMFGACMVTSVGMMGLDMAFSPITPYSQVPMLVTIGSIMDKAVVVDGKVQVRPMLTLTTTIDHRYVDGSEAARMAKTLKMLVEDPNLLEAVPGA